MKKIFFISVFLFARLGFAQNVNGYSKVDKLMLGIPDSCCKSTKSVADFINITFINDSEKIRAAFYWTATNISYDIENVFAINFNETSENKIKKSFETKKGICINYAEVFKDIANKIGIHSVIIEGYTKQNGFADYIPHAWCASKIDNNWCVFDPTWGSGYIANNKFVRKFNENYFKASPEKIIVSHMPFDFMWQFLNYPVSNQEFYEGNVKLNKSKEYFDFENAISVYEKESEVEKLVSSSNRIEKSGVKNSMIFDRLTYKRREIEYIKEKERVEKQNKQADDFNIIVTHYNEGINLLNEFINYRNNKFKPLISDEEIKNKVELPKQKLTFAQSLIDSLGQVEPNNQGNVDNVKKAIVDALKMADEQKSFVLEYLKKGKAGRKSMFTKVTWFGIPIN